MNLYLYILSFVIRVVPEFPPLQEEGLGEVWSLMEEEDGSAERRLREVLEELVAACGQYLTLARGSSSSTTSSAGRTKLDKERMRLCQREIVSVSFLILTISVRLMCS